MIDRFPLWIPSPAVSIYLGIMNNGGYSDHRLAIWLDNLFSSERLEKTWRNIARSMKWESGSAWGYLIGSIVLMIEVAPECGKRATKDSPSEKTRILDQQKRADKLIAQAAKLSRKLEEVLVELQENGGEMPGEIYSGLAWVKAAIDFDGMTSACWKSKFEEIRKNSSSYDRHHFPSGRQMVSAFADVLETHQPAKIRFANSPWLSSKQSSWRDCARSLLDNLETLEDCYSARVSLSGEDWTALMQVMLQDESISRQVVEAWLEGS